MILLNRKIMKFLYFHLTYNNNEMIYQEYFINVLNFIIIEKNCISILSLIVNEKYFLIKYQVIKYTSRKLP